MGREHRPWMLTLAKTKGGKKGGRGKDKGNKSKKFDGLVSGEARTAT